MKQDMKKRIAIAILKTIGTLVLLGVWVCLLFNYKTVVLISLIIMVIGLAITLFMAYIDY